MKILFIGGTGIISMASTALAAKRGIDVTLLTRGLYQYHQEGIVTRACRRTTWP